MSDMDELIADFTESFDHNPAFGFDKSDIIVVPTNLISLDHVLFGCGGIPRGRVIGSFGWEGSGKSALGHFFSACGTQYDTEYKTMWIDLEGAFVKSWATQMGQDMEHTILPNYEKDPESGELIRKVVTMEEVLTFIKWAIARGIDLVVIDSIANLMPKKLLDRNLLDRMDGKKGEKSKAAAMVGVTERDAKMNETLTPAKQFSSVWQKELMNGFEHRGEYYSLPDSGTCIYMINQLRSNPDAGKFGKKEIESGGNAIKFLLRQKFKTTKMGVSEKRTQDGSPLFQIIGLDMVKNTLAPPYRSTELILHFDGRVEESSDFIVNHARAKGILTVGGSWYTSPWGKVQGIAACAKLLKGHMKELDLEFKKVDEPELISEEEISEGIEFDHDSLTDLLEDDDE